MLERRPLFGLLVLLTVCLSIWRISLQEPSMVGTEVSYTNQFQTVHLRYLQEQQQQQPYQTSQTSFRTLTRTSPSIAELRWKHRILNGSIKRNITNSTTQLYLKSPSNSNNSSLQAHNFSSGNSNLSNSNLASLSTSVVNYKTLPKDDFNSLIDLHDFEFVLNQVPCGNAIPSNVVINSNQFGSNSIESDLIDPNALAPLLLILVHSAPANYRKRLLIRETWGSLLDQNLRLVFLLGTVNATDQQQSLEMENSRFADMVQGNFIDAYRNMTYKHVMALKWFSYYCPEAKYVLKTDDDVFINTPFLLKYLRTNASRHDLLFCQKIYSSRVKRSYRSKWRVSTKEYPGRFYPTYCPGYSIIYSQDVALRLYSEAQRTPYFWIDDVHVTGTLSQKANITITSFTSFVLRKSDCKEILAGKTDIDNFLFSWPDIEEDQTRSLWNLIRDIR